MIHLMRMRNDIAEKEKQLKELFAQKAEIQAKIDRLLSPETIVAPPSDFNLNDEIVGIIGDNANGVTVDSIFSQINSKWADLKIPRKKVNAALVYLFKRKKVLERTGKGIYRKLTI